MVQWLAWGVSLVTTQFFGTLTSRARNTASYRYHGICAALNHGSWYIASCFLAWSAVKNYDNLQAFLIALSFYTAVSTASSIAAHYLSINYLEKGNRRIGVYEDTK